MLHNVFQLSATRTEVASGEADALTVDLKCRTETWPQLRPGALGLPRYSFLLLADDWGRCAQDCVGASGPNGFPSSGSVCNRSILSCEALYLWIVPCNEAIWVSGFINSNVMCYLATVFPGSNVRLCSLCQSFFGRCLLQPVSLYWTLSGLELRKETASRLLLMGMFFIIHERGNKCFAFWSEYENRGL